MAFSPSFHSDIKKKNYDVVGINVFHCTFARFYRKKGRIIIRFCETTHLPLPWANILHQVRSWLWGRVSGQFPRNVWWPVPSVFCLGNSTKSRCVHTILKREPSRTLRVFKAVDYPELSENTCRQEPSVHLKWPKSMFGPCTQAPARCQNSGMGT